MNVSTGVAQTEREQEKEKHRKERRGEVKGVKIDVNSQDLGWLIVRGSSTSTAQYSTAAVAWKARPWALDLGPLNYEKQRQDRLPEGRDVRKLKS